jgi:hypothetical protein
MGLRRILSDAQRFDKIYSINKDQFKAKCDQVGIKNLRRRRKKRSKRWRWLPIHFRYFEGKDSC